MSEFQYGRLSGRFPAIVRSYDQATRTCRIEIPGLTEGHDVLPNAEIEYPIGDKSRKGAWETEIEILPGDTVWIEFIAGDSRYPIITGWRNPQTGNSVDWRRWHHANIELNAVLDIEFHAGQDIKTTAGRDITTSAVRELRLVVGNSSIVMRPDSITITTPKLDIVKA